MLFDSCRNRVYHGRYSKVAFESYQPSVFLTKSPTPQMRHWLLQSQQDRKYQQLQETMLRRNIALCPPSSYNTVKHTTSSFLGQNVVFRALNPYAAVSILTTIADEEFFEGIITSENEGSVEDVYEKLKRLVLLA